MKRVVPGTSRDEESPIVARGSLARVGIERRLERIRHRLTAAELDRHLQRIAEVGYGLPLGIRKDQLHAVPEARVGGLISPSDDELVLPDGLLNMRERRRSRANEERAKDGGNERMANGSWHETLQSSEPPRSRRLLIRKGVRAEVRAATRA